MMTVVPTNNLRFVEREVYFSENGDNLARTVRVLQQLFDTRHGREWVDVPLVTETQNEEG